MRRRFLSSLQTHLKHRNYAARKGKEIWKHNPLHVWCPNLLRIHWRGESWWFGEGCATCACSEDMGIELLRKRTNKDEVVVDVIDKDTSSSNSDEESEESASQLE